MHEPELLINLRRMENADWTIFHRLDEEIFPHDKWSRREFNAALRMPDLHALVALYDNRIPVGYIIYEMKIDYIHLLRIGVDRADQGCGVGKQMLELLMGRIRPTGRTCVMVEVREYNLAAQLFFRDFHHHEKDGYSFRAILPILRRHYCDTDEDGYRMCLRHPQATRPILQSSTAIKNRIAVLKKQRKR